MNTIICLVAGLVAATTSNPGPAVDRGVSADDIETVRAAPDPEVIPDAKIRGRIAATGRPWRVRHRASGVEFVLVPSGRYRRGVGEGDEDVRGDASPAHDVVISRPFYLARTEISNRLYRRFDPAHRSVGNGEREPDPRLAFDAPDQPAINLSWFDVAKFCDAHGLRLPTEAEWEYAARAGTLTPYPWGDDVQAGAPWANLANPAHAAAKLRESIAMTFDDGHFATAPVGALRANAFGLHDMIGNAWEWVSDWYAEDTYARCRNGVVDPRGPMLGTARVIRGSSFRSPFRGSPRVSFRGQTRPDATRTLARGFRPVLEVSVTGPQLDR